MTTTKTASTNNTETRVLLIEDNPGDARLVTEMLHEWNAQHPQRPGFTVKHCTLIADALPLLRDTERRSLVDVVVCDLSLSDSIAENTMCVMREIASQLPVVFLTGHTDESRGLTAMCEGGQDYLVKGEVEPVLIARTLRYAIERKQAQDTTRKIQERLHAQELLAVERERLMVQQETQIATLREVTQTLMDRINNPLSIILMTFEVWRRDYRLPVEVLNNIDTIRQAAFRISDALQEVSTLDKYKTLDTSFGKILDVYSKEEQPIEA